MILDAVTSAATIGALGAAASSALAFLFDRRARAHEHGSNEIEATLKVAYATASLEQELGDALGASVDHSTTTIHDLAIAVLGWREASAGGVVLREIPQGVAVSLSAELPKGTVAIVAVRGMEFRFSEASHAVSDVESALLHVLETKVVDG